MQSTFDATTWQLNHTALLNQIRTRLEGENETVFTENQNAFTLRGSSATLGGKPDLITSSDKSGTIYDAKTGRPTLKDGLYISGATDTTQTGSSMDPAG